MTSLLDWRRQPKESKEIVISILHREFPNPMEYHFDKNKMISHMNHALKSRQGIVRTVVNTKSPNPIGVSADDWRQVLNERQSMPNCWDQQREANCIQQETTRISRLGNDGKN